MPSYVPPKKNTAYVFYISLPSQSQSNTFQANPTLAAGDVKVAVDDAAPANLTTLPVVDADFTKRVKVSLSASEMNGDNITVIFSDASGAEWRDVTINIQTSAQQIDDLPSQVLAATVEGSLDVQETLRLLLSAQVGKSSGGGTTSVAFRDTADSKDRIAATVDSDGNRTAVTLDAS